MRFSTDKKGETMGKRGAAPKPQALKKLTGTYRKDRDGGVNLGATPKPRCPSFLGKAAKAEWKRISAYLYENDLLKYVDRGLFAAYCESYGQWVEMVIDLQNEPLTNLTNSNSLQANPKIKIAQQAKADMLRLGQQFGLTPSSRGRIVTGKTKAKEESLADKLFSIVND